MQSDIAHAVQELIKSGKVVEDGDIGAMPNFKTMDIYPIFEHAFNDKAKAALANNTKRLIHEYNRQIPAASTLILLGKLGLKTCAHYANSKPDEMYFRDFDIAYFVAARAIKDKLPKAIEKVIATVNHVADLDFTRAAMVQLSMLELACVDNTGPEFVVLSYITLTKDGAEYVKQNMPEMFVSEGELPDRTE